VAQVLRQPMSRQQEQPLEMAQMAQPPAFLEAALLMLAAVAAVATQEPHHQLVLVGQEEQEEAEAQTLLQLGLEIMEPLIRVAAAVVAAFLPLAPEQHRAQAAPASSF
jgi:hypothetical protein